MNRLLAGVFIGIAAALCLFGLVETVLSLLGTLLKVMSSGLTILAQALGGFASKMSDWFAFAPAGGNWWWLQVTRGVVEGDPLALQIIFYLFKLSLIFGIGVAIALLAGRTNSMSLAKGWCKLALILGIIYVAGVFIAPLFKFGFSPLEVAAFVAKRTGTLINAGLQIAVVIVASRYVDKELNLRPC